VLAILVAIVALALMSGPQATRLPTPGFAPDPPQAPATPPAPEFSPPTLPPELTERGEPPGWLGDVALVVGLLLGIAALAGLALLVRKLVRRLPHLPTRSRERPEVAVDERPPDADHHEAALEAVAAGMDELADESADPRHAVIVCWLRLEAAAAAAGTPRHPDDTPADFIARMLGVHRLAERPLQELGDIYRQARYSPEVPDESMRSTAYEILARLRAELATAASARSAADGDT
jgi:hypothetical protein